MGSGRDVGAQGREGTLGICIQCVISSNSCSSHMTPVSTEAELNETGHSRCICHVSKANLRNFADGTYTITGSPSGGMRSCTLIHTSRGTSAAAAAPASLPAALRAAAIAARAYCCISSQVYPPSLLHAGSRGNFSPADASARTATPQLILQATPPGPTMVVGLGGCIASYVAIVRNWPSDHS